ncbi:MAG: hypothetical protein QM691_09145 [Opitutaceae bacterium]
MKYNQNKTHKAPSSDLNGNDSIHPEAPCLDAPSSASVMPQGENPPATLAEAEAQLRAVAARYNQSGEQQFIVLKTICALVFTLKQIFEKTPRSQRPIRTWAKYAPAVAKRCGLRFQTERMADHYARLHVDMERAGPAEIQKRVSDGSYREARKAANELLNSTDDNRGGDDTSKLLQQAVRLVRKAMEEAYEDGHLRPLIEIQEPLGKAARADRKRDADVVPEMAMLGLPDRERRRINFAVRATSGDPVAAGIHAFDQCLFDSAPRVEGAIALPAWSRPDDVTLPLTDAGVSKWTSNWLEKRNAFIAALVRCFDPGMATQATNQAIA